MKRNIMLGLLNSVLCLSLMGNSSIEKVSAQHIDHNQINSICGIDPTQVGCWPMDGDVYDWSTFGNNGAAVGGPTYPSGHSGLAIHLNGTSQYVTVQNNNSLNITDSITLAAWIKPEKSATQDLLKKAITDDTDGYEISLSSDTKVIFHLNQNTSSDTYRIVSSQSYPIDGEIWIHVAATYNFGTNLMRLYINGVQDGTAITGPGAIASNDLFLGIGVQGDYDVSRLFQGAVDDVRIYNRALSAFEIKALYDETTPDGYTCTSLIARESTANTEHKPMSKTWIYDGKWWSVFPASTGVSSAGAWLWRLDGIVWTPVLKLSDTTVTKADVKPAGSLVHVLLYNGTSADLASAEYDAGNDTYITWSGKSGLASVSLPGSETATIDIDSTGRMWLATQHNVSTNREIIVYYSDSPYSSWSTSITLATITNNQDDISLVSALPNNTIGVLWSNQSTSKKKFGFRYHIDSADPGVANWSALEEPTSQFGYSRGTGFADDHLNVAVASDGTLYAAVKTGYDTVNYPKIALMVRRLSGTSGAGLWDDLTIYEVSQSGTRPILLLDEDAGVLNVIYTSAEGGGEILYQQSALQPIAFGPVQTMRGGMNNDVSSTKQNINGELVAIYSNSTSINGSFCTSSASSGVDLSITKTDNKTAALPGDSSTYTIVVSNGTTAAVSDVTVVDNFPLSLTGITWTCSPGAGSTCTASGSGNIDDSITLAASGSVTYVASATISSSANGVVENTATVTPPAGVTDMYLANNTTTDLTTLRSGGNLCGNDPNLVACYQLDEGASNVILDGVQNTVYNDGTVNGTSGYWTSAGKVGNALDLDGSTHYAYSPDEASLDIVDQITLAGWIKPERYDATPQYLIKKGFMGSANGYELGLSSTGSTWPEKIFVRFNQLSQSETCRVNSSISYPHDGATWMHVAATFDGTTIRLYINGVLDDDLVVPSGCTTISTNDQPLTIGAQYNGTIADGFYQGTIDDVRVYNHALNDAEIANLYGLPTSVKLVDFKAMSLPQGIQLAWQSAQENDLVGFNLLRAEALDGSQVKINPELISAINPGQFVGSNYTYMDTTADSGKAYYYWIEWMGDTGSEIYGPVIASLAPYMVWLPLGVR